MRTGISDWRDQLVFHVKRGPVIVKVSDVCSAFDSSSLSKSCFLLSKLTPKYVDYYPSEASPRFVLLAMKGDRFNSRPNISMHDPDHLNPDKGGNPT